LHCAVAPTYFFEAGSEFPETFCPKIGRFDKTTGKI
jgi:hypothetical protein